MLRINELRLLYQKARQTGDMLQGLLDALELRCEIDPGDLARIPASGPVVAVANHPFGMLEGVLLGTLLPKVRPDFKFVTNRLLAEMPELHPFCFFVDPFGEPGSEKTNIAPLRAAARYLKAGGMLIMFPAGEVSHWDLRRGGVADSDWNPTVARLICMAKAQALPMYFRGHNSAPFHMLGMIHSKLRTAALPNELLNKRGKTIGIRIGRTVPPEVFDGMDREAITNYLRRRTYLLANRDGGAGKKFSLPFRPAAQPVADAVVCDALETEIASLSPIEQTKEFAVYIARAASIPQTLLEIGRLREETFRAVGEGSGKPLDLDRFDAYYEHLFVWSKEKREIVGAYRLGRTHEILARYGVKGLYTSTLFHFDWRFFWRIGPAVELGRSFVRSEYQKQFAPLLLLWKGISSYVAANPGAPVLFGAVSVSNSYHPASRELIVRFFAERDGRDQLTSMLKPRHPFRPPLLRKWDLNAITRAGRDVEDLSGPIADIERDGKGVPILIKQYLKLGGRLIAFNVDSRFSHALDGLVLVDLRTTDRAILDRYMGRERAAAFTRYHQASSGSAA